MKPIAALAFAAIALLPFAVQAQQQGTVHPAGAAIPDDPAVRAATGAAAEAAQRWLALADTDRWDDCWSALAPAAQSAIDQETFGAALGAVRTQFGAVKARKPRSANFTHQLPNAPAGDYVVIQYDTDFAGGAHAVETVTPMRTPDGSWKVSGYFVH